MKNIVLRNLFRDDSYQRIKFDEISGRYVTNASLELVIEKFRKDFEIDVIEFKSLGNLKIKDIKTIF